VAHVLLLLLLTACGRDPQPADSGLPEGAWLPGGVAGTNTLLGGANSFIMPMPGLTAEHEGMFYSGNGYFNQSWVEAPSSTAARDGLGPLFNARSCSACHFKDGRAAPPEDGQAPFGGVLLRVSRDGPSGAEPDPAYGFQIQDVASPGVQPEFLPRVTWETLEGSFPDGERFELTAPTYHLDQPAHGAPDPSMRVSPRVAVQVIGLALLEAIPEARLEALADPDDVDADGISGRMPWTTSLVDGETVAGRFGWKGEAASVVDQSAKAAAEDLGLTSWVAPEDDCTPLQTDCLAQESGGEPEISDRIFERLVLYTRALAVPARRAADDPDVLAGQGHFTELGCVGCHVPQHETGPFPPLPELEGQEIHPYTDLLLHDMGPALADDRPIAAASGSEWQTRPLWGIGLLEVVNGHTRLLHDGRANGIEEAILWHGGEAEGPKAAFMALSRRERAQLVAFVSDL